MSIVTTMAARVLMSLKRDNAEWRLSGRLAYLLIGAAVALAVVPVLLLPLRDAYRSLLVEDGPVEWLQFACLVLIAPTYLWLARDLRHRRQTWLAGLYLVAAIGVVFIAGEEISWGQRIIGWATPESIAAINKQDETNIHNVGLVLRVFNAATLTIALLAIALPIARWTIWPNRARSAVAYALVPPLALAPAFALAFAYRAMRFVIIPEAGFSLTKYQEATELAFYLALLSFGLLAVRVFRHEAGQTRRVSVAEMGGSSGIPSPGLAAPALSAAAPVLNAAAATDQGTAGFGPHS
jgi:hypothetical protein